jgi:hypothetical protein
LVAAALITRRMRPERTMDYSLREAFEHRELKDVRVLLKEASFYLGNLKTEVRIRLYVRPKDETTICFEQSHHLQTPMHTEHMSPGLDFGDSEEEAFHEAVTKLTDAYDMAVMSGHRPSEDWLVPNKFF